MIDLPEYQEVSLLCEASDDFATRQRLVYGYGTDLFNEAIAEILELLGIPTTSEHWTVQCVNWDWPTRENVDVYARIHGVKVYKLFGHPVDLVRDNKRVPLTRRNYMRAYYDYQCQLQYFRNRPW